MGVSEHILAQLYIFKDVLTNIQNYVKAPDDIPKILKQCVQHQQKIYQLVRNFPRILFYLDLKKFLIFLPGCLYFLLYILY